MIEHARRRTSELQRRMSDAGIPLALLTDPASIAWLANFWGYLGLEFGRPTALVLRPDGPPCLITPLMESEMAGRMSWIDDIRPWEDAGSCRWPAVLGEALAGARDGLWVERPVLPGLLHAFLEEQLPDAQLRDISPLLAEMRMIKAPEEIAAMRSAGRVAGAMMRAAEASLAEGTPEYESALAIAAAGTRETAKLLSEDGRDRFVSPLVHNLQIMQSGADTTMVHRRASTRRYRRGDPVYFCFCNRVEFRQYKLGFDRMFHIGEVSDEAARVQQAAIDAQTAALAAIHPGATAEEVAFAADAVYAERGFTTGYRTGRSIGMAYLEAPELKAGDRTILRPGMTFAVDGGVSAGAIGGRIGDSVVVTESGYEFLTDYPRQIMVV